MGCLPQHDNSMQNHSGQSRVNVENCACKCVMKNGWTSFENFSVVGTNTCHIDAISTSLETAELARKVARRDWRQQQLSLQTISATRPCAITHLQSRCTTEHIECDNPAAMNDTT